MMAVTLFPNFVAGDVTALTQARQYRVVKIVAAESTATSTTDALAALIAANPDISVVSLEQLAAQVCELACHAQLFLICCLFLV